MDMYNKTLRRVDLPDLPKEHYIKIDGIPEGLERFEPIKLIIKKTAFMYRASVFEIDEDENCFWLTVDKQSGLWI